jgi:hypothetical protein
VQGFWIGEGVVARRALDLQNEPGKLTRPFAPEQAEGGVSSGLAVPIGLASHLRDAAIASRAQPLFRSRTEDGR